MRQYDYPSYAIDFAIQQINKALEEAAIEILDEPTVERSMAAIRALKIKD